MSRNALARIARCRPYTCAQCRRQQTSRRALHSPPRPDPNRSSVLALLEERGYVSQIAGDRNALDSLLRRKQVGVYAGIDPTASSLHLGHLLPLMVLFWMSIYGHNAVSLVGGATAKVGDPSGRLTSRAKTVDSVQRSNATSMSEQLSALWRNAGQYAERHGYSDTRIEDYRLLDNGKWLNQLNVLDFLRSLGNGMRLGTMLGRETVRNKMEKGDGMSFSEFTYPLLQAWDWWHMYITMEVQLQVGGNDQYGNIIAGMDAVRHIAQSQEDATFRALWLDKDGRLLDDLSPMGLTVPLLTTGSGEKFGKSAGNAVWLDRTMTSTFDLYGFLLRSSDADVERFLKLFTFVPSENIQTLMEEHQLNPGERKAQHLLASEVLELVHGREEASKTRAEHEASRNPTLATFSGPSHATSSPGPFERTAQNDRIQLPKSLVVNTPFARILYHAGLVSSKSEGARLIAKGGVYVASSTDDENLVWTQIKDQKPEDVASLLLDRLLMLRLGKWKVRTIEIVDDYPAEKEADESPAP